MDKEPNHRAIYTGSFDPPTYGHLDVIARGRRVFDEIVVAIGRNIGKKEIFPMLQRKEMMRQLTGDLLKDEVGGGKIRVETYEGLTLDFAREQKAQVILRGIRNISDLAYECQLAMTNREVADLETIFIMTSQKYAYTSSNLIKQIAALGGDLNRLDSIVPAIVIDALRILQDEEGLAHLIEDHID